MEVAVDDVVVFASRPASESGLDSRPFVYHLRRAGDFVGHVIGSSGVREAVLQWMIVRTPPLVELAAERWIV
jgi:hypothetical protein